MLNYYKYDNTITKTLTDSFSKGKTLKNEFEGSPSGYDLTINFRNVISYASLLVRYSNGIIERYIVGDNSAAKLIENDELSPSQYSNKKSDNIKTVILNPISAIREDNNIKLRNVMYVSFTNETLETNSVMLSPELDLEGNDIVCNIPSKWWEIYRDTILSIGTKSVFLTMQCGITKHPTNIDDCYEYYQDTSLWEYPSPTYMNYKKLNLQDNYHGNYRFPNPEQFPGTIEHGVASNYSTNEFTAKLYIPISGTYSFAIEHDDGCKFRLQKRRSIYRKDYFEMTSYKITVFKFAILLPGYYDLYILHFNQGGPEVLSLSAKYGSYNNMDASFKLIGTPECPIKVF